MSLFSNTSVLLGKELRTEFRSRELLTTTVVFYLDGGGAVQLYV